MKNTLKSLLALILIMTMVMSCITVSAKTSVPFKKTGVVFKIDGDSYYKAETTSEYNGVTTGTKFYVDNSDNVVTDTQILKKLNIMDNFVNLKNAVGNEYFDMLKQIVSEQPSISKSYYDSSYKWTTNAELTKYIGNAGLSAINIALDVYGGNIEGVIDGSIDLVFSSLESVVDAKAAVLSAGIVEAGLYADLCGIYAQKAIDATVDAYDYDSLYSFFSNISSSCALFTVVEKLCAGIVDEIVASNDGWLAGAKVTFKQLTDTVIESAFDSLSEMFFDTGDDEVNELISDTLDVMKNIKKIEDFEFYFGADDFYKSEYDTRMQKSFFLSGELDVNKLNSYMKLAEDNSSYETLYEVGTYTPSTREGCNIREYPSDADTVKVVGTIAVGTNFVVTQVDGNWGKTTCNGIAGWVCLEYATPITSEEQLITRDDGTWFFPVAQQYYQKFSDWCCCPGNDKCILCNSYHSGWGDSAHSGQKGHNGIDLATPTGTPVYAAAPGIFYKGGSNSHSRGYYVVIEHPIGNNLSYYSTYQHLNSFNTALSNGQSVEAGDLIGYSGGSGAGSGVHLHFGIVIGNSGKGISGVDTYELWSSSNPWATKPEQTQGRIVNNPADNFPTSTAGATLEAIKMHKGSVHYTFDPSKVDVGFDNTGSGDSSSTTTYSTGTYKPKDTIGLNLRSTQSAVSDTNILAAIPYGTAFIVTSVSNGWGKVTYNGKTGWVSLEWATLVNDTVQEPNTSASKYNPQKAVEYAKNHWNDGKGWCAEFVSDCLAAGGCTAWNRGCTSLISQLKRENWGVEYQLTLDSNGYIRDSLNSGKIAAGDLIFHYCTNCRDYGDGKPYIHVYICSGVDSSGYWLGYAHNNAYSGRIYGKGYCYAYTCNCPTSIAYVFHMTATADEKEDEDDSTQWSDWSDWSTTKPTASDTVQVESKTQYGYYHYILQYSNGNCGAYPIDATTFNKIFPSYPTTQRDYHTKYFDTQLSKIDTLTYNGTTYNCYANTCCPDSYNYDNGSNASYFYDLGTRTVYRSRTKLPETISVNSVTLNKNSVTLEVGATETLTATITPNNATNKNVSWTSSNPSVATVSNGVVTAKVTGTTTITVTTEDGGKTATCTVTVTAAEPNFPSTDEKSPLLSLDGAKTSSGKTVSLALKTTENPGFTALNISLEYDKTYLTLTNIENELDGFVMTSDKTIVWDGAENYTEDGILANLTFEVAEDAPEGEYEIKVIFIDAVNYDFEDVEFETVSGIITVTDVVYGDANGDGNITTTDLAMVRRYIASKDPVTGESSISVQAGADANGDGSITTTDLAMIRRYIASKDPVTGESSIVLGPKS